MGGVGAPPDVRPRRQSRTRGRQRHRLPPPRRPKAEAAAAFGPNGKQQLPVALIFACLVVVYVGIRYLWR